MEILQAKNATTFYGRSIRLDGKYHIVQSSTPPCTELSDVDSCCGTTKFKIITDDWINTDTDKTCGNSDDNDDVIVEFSPRPTR